MEMKQLGIFFIFFFIVMISRAQTVVQDDVLQYEKEMLGYRRANSCFDPMEYTFKECTQ